MAEGDITAFAEIPEKVQVWRLHLAALRANGGAAELEPDTQRYGLNLGRWAADQKIARHTNSLQQWQIDALDAIPGWSWTFKSGPGRPGSLQRITWQLSWENHYDLLVEYAEEHDRIPQEWITHRGIGIGRWATNQRRLYRAGNLLLSRIELLEKVPRWQWGRENELKWQNKYQQLLNYVNFGGKLPSRDFDMSKSADLMIRWMVAQRHARRTGRLSDKNAALLEALPGWTWGSAA